MFRCGGVKRLCGEGSPCPLSAIRKVGRIPVLVELEQRAPQNIRGWAEPLRRLPKRACRDLLSQKMVILSRGCAGSAGDCVRIHHRTPLNTRMSYARHAARRGGGSYSSMMSSSDLNPAASHRTHALETRMACSVFCAMYKRIHVHFRRP